MNDNKVKNLVITAFFTAITFLGIQSFRIPLPAAVGTPYFRVAREELYQEHLDLQSLIC